MLMAGTGGTLTPVEFGAESVMTTIYNTGMARDLSSVTFTPHLFMHPNQIETSQVEMYVRRHFPQLDFSPYEWLNPDLTPPSIESIRDFIQDTAYAVDTGKTRLIGLAAIDGASIPAQNALLKLLEEPPVHYFLVLTARQTVGLLPTIQSRCVIIDLRSDEVIENTAYDHDTTPSESESLYDQLLSAPAWEIITIAGKIPDKTEALALITGLLQVLESRQQLHPTSQQTRHQAILMVAYQQIQANVNSKLALEAAFFQLTSQIVADRVR